MPISKKDATVWTDINYMNSKASAESMINNKYVQTGLITGTAWDAVCHWIKSDDEENIQDLQKEIRKEEFNIKKYEYESKKQYITIGNNLIAIKNISSLEKRALGMQLYHKLCNHNDLVMERPNNKVKNTTQKVNEIKQIEEKKVEPTKEVKQETVKTTNDNLFTANA